MQAVIALDVGTTAVKAAVVDRRGNIHARSWATYPLLQKGVEVTQSASDWWQAVQQCIQSLLSTWNQTSDLAAIVLTGQMQDLILLDGQEALAPVILYSDMRATQQASQLCEQVGEESLIRVTGNLQDASSLLAKLLWLREHSPELYASAQKILIGAHDYITYRLCGTAVTDYTTASTTGLFDLSRNQWAESLMTRLALRCDWLPDLLPYEQPAGRVSAFAAKATGLTEGLPVFHGIGDAAAATIGAAAGEGNCWYIYLGTSGWLAAVFNSPPVDPRSGIFNLRHPDGKRLILIGPMLTAAGNFDWLAQQFGVLESDASLESLNNYEKLNYQAAKAGAGSNGVLFLPYLNGERSPFRDPNARGVFFGLSLSTTRQEMYRAVMEGVAFAMRTIRDAMPSEQAPQQLSLVGGGARSTLWAQIFADVFDCPVAILADPGEVGTRGAALVAARALGWQPNLAPADYFPIEQTCYPIPENATRYNRLYPIFRSLYPSLKSSFQALASVSL
jgi:xylulokinase